MATARLRLEWGQSASLMAHLANCLGDGKRHYLPTEFNPLEHRAQPTKAPITALKAFLPPTAQTV